MRAGAFLAYWPWFTPAEQVELAVLADRLGLDSAWVAEAWGQDAVSVLGLLGKSTTNKILDNLGQVAPGGVKSFLTTVINQVAGKGGTAGIAAIIGLVVALWSASGYVAAFMRASMPPPP